MTGRPDRKWPRRLLWGAAVLLVLLVGVLVGLRATLPWLMTRVAEKASRQYLGLPLEIGNIDLKLRSGEILLENVRVAGTAGKKTSADAKSSLSLIHI